MTNLAACLLRQRKKTWGSLFLLLSKEIRPLQRTLWVRQGKLVKNPLQTPMLNNSNSKTLCKLGSTLAEFAYLIYMITFTCWTDGGAAVGVRRSEVCIIWINQHMQRRNFIIPVNRRCLVKSDALWISAGKCRYFYGNTLFSFRGWCLAFMQTGLDSLYNSTALNNHS